MASDNLTVLNALDTARTQWYHVTAVVIAGMGFFTDAYDLFCITTVSKLLGRLYYYDPATHAPGKLPHSVNNWVIGVALVGTLTGQLVFGWLGDKLGRKKVYGLTLILMVICALCSGLSFGYSRKVVIGTLCFFRFWLGFGIGGDYPLSATIMSEYANKRTRGAFIAAVFAMQGVGIIFAGLVSMIVSKVFLMNFGGKAFSTDEVFSTEPEADYVWRIVLMLGALPALLTYYWRMKMPETGRYTAIIEGNAKQAAIDMGKVLDIEIQAEGEKLAKFKAANEYSLLSNEFFMRHGHHLIGTMTTWFLLDIAFYSQNLTQKDIFPTMGLVSNAKNISALREMFETSRAMFVIALLGTFPGYWFTVFFIEKMGRFKIQLMGFFMMSVFMAIIGIKYDYLKTKEHKWTFAALYGLTFFFANFGPNSTTFVLPAELFPTRVRSTCHALSAASGKAGAMVSAFGVQEYTQDGNVHKIKKAMLFLAFTNMIGFCCTFLVTETKGRSLEEISGEDEKQNETQMKSNRTDSGLLNALDTARTQWYHVTAVIIAGMGFFTDAYDLFCITTISKLLGRLYYYDPTTHAPGKLPHVANNWVIGVALVGTLSGQLVFGWLGDKLGRKKVYGLTLILMVLCALCSGLSLGYSAKGVIGTLCFFRFWLGFGIGGDYPLSATIMSEYANKATRGAFIAAVFAMQGVGIIFAGLVSMIISKLFLMRYEGEPFNVDEILSTEPQADYVWRIVLMLGALPALLTYYWRMKMPETGRYTAIIEGNAKQAAINMGKVLDIEIQAESDKLAQFKAANEYSLLSNEFFQRHGLHLIGTMSTWFLLDIAFYSQNLTQKDIFPVMGLTSNANTISALREMFETSRAMFVIALFGTFPGYWFTVFFIEKIGRFRIQLMGFFMMSVFMAIIGVKYDYLKSKEHKWTFATLYGLTFFFANFGPNSTTFVLPAELFPTRVRSTCHALSAASGKAGAMISAFGIQQYTQDGNVHKIKTAMILLAVTNMAGFCCTFLVTETKGRSLEEITGEDGGQNETQMKTSKPVSGHQDDGWE
uniref:Major facilitator superfamily (MFS) profile domain-containing protein n=1 Tax=Solanum lycopersicum TaxID=4081 RepID=A0A3Q7GW18_SOLLC